MPSEDSEDEGEVLCCMIDAEMVESESERPVDQHVRKEFGEDCPRRFPGTNRSWNLFRTG